MSAYPALFGLDMAWSSHIVLDAKPPTHEALQELNETFAREDHPESFGFGSYADLERSRSYSMEDVTRTWGRIIARIDAADSSNTGTATLRGIIAACHDFDPVDRRIRFKGAMHEVAARLQRCGVGTMALPFGGQMFGPHAAMQMFNGVCDAVFDPSQTSGTLQWRIRSDGRLRFVHKPEAVEAPSIIPLAAPQAMVRTLPAPFHTAHAA